MSEALIGNIYDMIFMGNLFHTSSFHKALLSYQEKMVKWITNENSEGSEKRILSGEILKSTDTEMI